MSVFLLASSFTDVRPGLIFWTLVSFILMALILRWKAWGPILSLVQEREKQIRDSLESAARGREEAERMLTEQKTAIAQARREAASLVRQNQLDMEKFRDNMMADARKRAEEEMATAQRQIHEERAKAVAEVKEMSVSLAIEIARKLIGSEMDDHKQRVLAEQFIDQLPKPGAQA
jgi:F-type H+-transporting ATPase subunit b